MWAHLSQHASWTSEKVDHLVKALDRDGTGEIAVGSWDAVVALLEPPSSSQSCTALSPAAPQPSPPPPSSTRCADGPCAPPPSTLLRAVSLQTQQAEAEEAPERRPAVEHSHLSVTAASCGPAWLPRRVWAASPASKALALCSAAPCPTKGLPEDRCSRSDPRACLLQTRWASFALRRGCPSPVGPRATVPCSSVRTLARRASTPPRLAAVRCGATYLCYQPTTNGAGRSPPPSDLRH